MLVGDALRAVRGWLKPSIMFHRYWRAFCGKPRPPVLRTLLDRVFSAESSTSLSPNNKLPSIKPNDRRAFQPVACARPDKPCTTLLEQIG